MPKLAAIEPRCRLGNSRESPIEYCGGAWERQEILHGSRGTMPAQRRTRVLLKHDREAHARLAIPKPSVCLIKPHGPFTEKQFGRLCRAGNCLPTCTLARAEYPVMDAWYTQMTPPNLPQRVI
jgi:hypothetical protein